MGCGGSKQETVEGTEEAPRNPSGQQEAEPVQAESAPEATQAHASDDQEEVKKDDHEEESQEAQQVAAENEEASAGDKSNEEPEHEHEAEGSDDQQAAPANEEEEPGQKDEGKEEAEVDNTQENEGQAHEEEAAADDDGGSIDDQADDAAEEVTEEEEKRGPDRRQSTAAEEDVSGKDDDESSTVLAGWLRKRGGGTMGKAWKKRYIVLDHGELTYYKSKTDYDNNVPPLKSNHINLKNYELIVNPNGNPLQFNLKPKSKEIGTRVWEFAAKDEVVFNSWLDVFQEEGVTKVEK